MLGRLAWRNLWRQKRRTLLTAVAIALIFVLSLFVRSLQEGVYLSNIEHGARLYTGLLQLQHPQFFDSRSIDDLLELDSDSLQSISKIPGVKGLLPRLESFALAAGAERSKAVMVLGVAPELENHYNQLSAKVVAGHYFQPYVQGVLLGQRLAKALQLSVGDQLVLYGQGYRGQTAAGVYPIVGIVAIPMPALDRQLVYMPLSTSQQLFSAPDLVSSWRIDLSPLSQLTDIKQKLTTQLGDSATLYDWRALSPEMAQQIDLDKAGGVVMISLLYIVVGFGLFATLVMSCLERQREFSVMLATGMTRLKLATLLVVESLYLAVLGIVIGLMLGLPLITWFYFHPIELVGESADLMIAMGWEPVMHMAWQPALIAGQVGIVLLLTVICLLYPIWRSARLSVVQGLKGGAHGD